MQIYVNSHQIGQFSNNVLGSPTLCQKETHCNSRDSKPVIPSQLDTRDHAEHNGGEVCSKIVADL